MREEALLLLLLRLGRGVRVFLLGRGITVVLLLAGGLLVGLLSSLELLLEQLGVWGK